MLGCHADSFSSSGSHNRFPPSFSSLLQRQGDQWVVNEHKANQDVLQASAGVVDGLTPRTSATATPMATRAWSWSMGESTRPILHTNPAP